ncbi:molybdopterin-dependent oxidoreductase [Pseudarthrobacter sp. AL07]|uniref:molybdopterin-dependent oxidoreductase n=1 Tax=unclassified Pseudarthrobacter TaxID=2647000 RepID=UPI00249C9CC3|nr:MULTISPECIES: molybdopterin-dependent oxidoreductase [unclassified Pseudarthrobacter]MDI3194986.1 molybdopterin-dependent oxidoreductase [Pseudarthrobacter sp. AL20]MDI3209142.1 molybdopterin-dependent oxidoreductase [Pseudarthrobacter sp. AL07]
MDRLTTLLQQRMEAVNGRFSSRLRSKRLTVVLGRWLGMAFTVCFLTGLFSHLLQDPPGWMLLPTRPVWVYAATQGIHVTTGIASIPLLAAKLWSVFPELLRWPPLKSVVHALERGSIALFVSASLVEVTIGLLNTFQWYPWPFSFKDVHYWLGWVIIGSLALHIAVKLPLIRAHWSRRSEASAIAGEAAEAAPEPDTVPAAMAPATRPGWSRRGFLAAMTAGTGVVVLTTAGQSVAWLAGLNLFAPRRMDAGPQGVPVNRTAAQAGVEGAALAPDWVLTVSSGPVQKTLTLSQLAALPQHSYGLPIACVEGWSQGAQWRGVRIRDLMALVGAPADAGLQISSMEKGGVYGRSFMPAAYSQDDMTLLALELNGAPLNLDHGYPARIIAPGRPGVLQTKWVHKVEVI